MKLYVKKLCSLNPKKYNIVEINDAVYLYTLYILACEHSPKYKNIIVKNEKSFSQWLQTEI